MAETNDLNDVVDVNDLEANRAASAARARLTGGRIRAFVADLQEAASGLEVWSRLSLSLEVKQRAHDEALANFLARERTAKESAAAAEHACSLQIQAAEQRSTTAWAETRAAEARRDKAVAEADDAQKRLQEAQRGLDEILRRAGRQAP